MKHNNVYTLDEQGQIIFREQDRLHMSRNKAESVWHHPWMLIAIVVVALIADFASFASLFDYILYDNIFLRYIAISAMLLAFEVGPCYAFMTLKKKREGYNVSNISIILPIVAFLLAAVANLLLRLATAEAMFPALSGASTSTIGNGSLAGASSGNSSSTTYAIFFAILPILTTIIASAASYTLHSPLNAERKKLQKQQMDLTRNIDQLEAMLSEFSSAEDYLNRLLSDDQAKYDAASGALRHQLKEYADYVRQRIGAFLADPTAIGYQAEYNFQYDDNLQ